MKNIGIVISLATALILTACGDECSSYSDFSCADIEKAEYNVYFSFPDSDESYPLGQVSGLSACGSRAWAYAAEKGLDRNNEWSYICCMIAKGSSCYEKHR